MLNSNMSDETVIISKKEFERLQKLEADLPAMLEAAKEEERKDALTRLHQRDKENPEAAKKRYKKHYNLNKDAVNAKRREAYRLKKEANLAKTIQSPGDSSNER